jgi:hypothetical protein
MLSVFEAFSYIELDYKVVILTITNDTNSAYALENLNWIRLLVFALRN